MNLFLVGSPWHLILAAAISAENRGSDAFLIEEISPNAVDSMVSLCSRLGLRYEVLGSISKVRFNGLKIAHLPSFYKRTRGEFNRVSETMARLLAANRVDRIYYFNFFSPITRAALLRSGRITAELVRVEDGICDYFDFPLVHYPLPLRAMKSILSYVMGFGAIYARESVELRRDTRLYLACYPDKVPNWSGNKSSLKSYWGAVKAIYDQLLQEQVPRYSHAGVETCLVIGHTLAEDRVIALEQEMAIYESLVQDGRQIYFKPHPRSSQQKLDALGRIDGLTLIAEPLSVEEIIAREQFDRVTGFWSNPVIYAPLIFDVKTDSLLAHIDSQDKNFLRVRGALERNFSSELGI